MTVLTASKDECRFFQLLPESIFVYKGRLYTKRGAFAVSLDGADKSKVTIDPSEMVKILSEGRGYEEQKVV